MTPDRSERRHPGRRDFLRTATAVTAGAMVYPHLQAAAQAPVLGESLLAARAGWQVRPFPLTQVRLSESVFTQKRDRMLNYLRNYGSATDPLAGPDRMLSIFRANAGLDTKGAEPPGSWENETGYLRGHYAGHFMSALAQAYAGTGDPVYKQKLDYMVNALVECQQALAAAAKQPTPRVAGKFGNALELSGSPVGHMEHVSLPGDLVNGLRDFSIAFWVNPSLYDQSQLPHRRPNDTPEALANRSVVFDFGRPNEAYAEAPQAHMYLTVRASNEAPVPRFAITTSGEEGEQRLDGKAPLAMGEWTHIAVTRRGNLGTLYVNGEAVATNEQLTLSPADLQATTSWLGRRQFPQRSISYLKGQLDEFQVFDRALSAADVRSLQTSAAGRTRGGNVAWYRFDEPNGMQVTDSSGKNRHGTVIGPWDGRRHASFISAYPETQFIRLEEFSTYGSNLGIWAPYYTLHKIMAGLLDAHTMTGNAQALQLVAGIGDWVASRLMPLPAGQLDRMFNIYIAGEYGGINESLAQLHGLFPQKAEYLATARKFDNRNVKDPVQENRDILDGRHANQHIPQFIGYLRVFEESDVPEYYAAAEHFWDMIVPHRTYSHGGIGVGEILRARDVIAGSLWSEEGGDHAETCCMYNMLKLSRNLFFHDPDPKYMNYYELGLFNQILSSRRDHDSAETPEVTYFVPVRPGERRRYGNTGTCCGGTGMENHTKYQDSIYFRSADDATLYVNLYIPSTLQWPEKGFTIEQVTRYPLEGASSFTVNGNGRLAIKLRVPEWVRKGYTVRVNGRAERVEAAPGTYVTLDREWRAGDRIEVAMPFSFHVERTIDDATVQSLYYGPTLLAIQAPRAGTNLDTGLLKLSFFRSLKLDGDLGAALAPAAQPLHFTTQGQTLFPFHVADPQAGDETVPYHMYFRREEPAVVFGSVDSGVRNTARDGGATLLDDIWAAAPFADQRRFIAHVQRVTNEWRAAGRISAADASAVVQSARRAERELRPARG